MKSVVNNMGKPIKFPIILVNEPNSSVWLMRSSTEGTLLSKGTSNYDIGDRCVSLCGDSFTQLIGSVTLSND